MTNPPPPPRKPRFLSSVPAEQTIENARFGRPGPGQIRPVAPDAQTTAAVKPTTGLDDPQALTRTPGQASAGANPAAPSTEEKTAQGGTAAPAPAPAPAPAVATVTTVPLELVRSRLAAAIDALRLQSEKLAEQARADVLEVAFQIARRIVEVEVRQSPEPLFALIRQSLGQLSAARKITLRVSPQDIDALRSARGQETTSTLAMAEIELSVDAALEPGECLIESDLGQIDGRLANRFAELRRQVSEASEGAA